MKNNIGFILIIAVCLISGCASVPVSPSKKIIISERLVFSTQPKRPEWTYEEPEQEGDKLIFIGLSDKLATEKSARESAQDDAAKNVVKYIGNSVKVEVTNIATSYGLSSEIRDPLIITKQIEEHIAEAFVSRIKPKDWYIEKYEVNYKYDPAENYFCAFVLVTVPKEELKRAIKEQLEEQRRIAESAKGNIGVSETAISLFGDDNNTNDLRIDITTDRGANPAYKDGEKMQFYFQANRNCYVYVFHIDFSGTLRMLYPNSWHKENKIEADKRYIIPDENMKFDFQVSPPYGSEVAIAIGTLKPIKDFDISMEQKEFKSIGEVGSREVKRISDSIRRITPRSKAIKKCVLTTYKE